MTSISVASAGTVTNWCQTNRPGANMAPTPIAVPMVSHHSSFLFSDCRLPAFPPCDGSGRRNSHERDNREEDYA